MSLSLVVRPPDAHFPPDVAPAHHPRRRSNSFSFLIALPFRDTGTSPYSKPSPGAAHETHRQEMAQDLRSRARRARRHRARNISGFLQACRSLVQRNGRRARLKSRSSAHRRPRHSAHTGKKRRGPVLRAGLHHRPRADVPDGPHATGRQGELHALRRRRWKPTAISRLSASTARRSTSTGGSRPNPPCGRRIYARSERLPRRGEAPAARVLHSGRKTAE